MGDRARLPRSNDPRSLYVITLFSSLMPMPLEVPDPRGLEGLAVFRSRRLEDGRERYRLHLGYFDARVDAEDALPIVQKHFPSAWVASAPRSGLGSLDDTNLSEFRLLRSPTLLATTIEAHSNAPTAPAQDAQRYVVQLSWASQRIDPSEITQLAIFQAYALYTVTLARAGMRYYGIRLGFFTSAISARQVALYVRSEFPEVAVVPISEREYARAREMVTQREIRARPQGVPTAAPDITPEAPVSETTETTETLEQTESAPLEASVLAETTDITTDDIPIPQTTAESTPVQTPAPTPEITAESIALPAPQTAAETTSPISRPPFTEVYVAEAAARMSGNAQNQGFTREELLGALASPRSDENARRSAIVRLLHRLADRIG
jgi:hypothetical protein